MKFFQIVRCLIVALALSYSSFAYAADADDIYGEFSAGLLFRSGSMFQGTATLGYLPWQEIGLGVVFDQITGLNERASISSGMHFGVETRWFLEPFELAASMGYFSLILRDDSLQSGVLLTTQLQYLVAVTSSLAITSAARLFLPLGLAEENGLQLSLGFRVLY